MYTSEERVADGILHVIGITTGVIAVIAMMAASVRVLPFPATASLAIYGSGMLAMFGSSAAYNLVSAPKWTGTLQRLDHAAIFLKIAGTYTPFGVIMGGIAGYAMLSVVWAIALLGAAGKLLKTNWSGIDVPIYLILGWIGVLIYRPLADTVSPIALELLALGGVLYSVGVIFHIWRDLKYHNAIWHAFVLVATGCHFGAVTTAVFA